MAIRRGSSKKAAHDDSPISAQQRKIAEEQARVAAELAKYKKLLDDAPRIAREQQKLRQEQIVARRAKTEPRRPRSNAGVPNHRLALDPGAAARQKRLRIERNKGRAMFFVLLIIFAVVMAWLYFSVIQRPV